MARWLTRAELMDTGCDHTMILTSSVTPSAVDRTRCTGVVCVWRHNVLYYSYSRATSLLVAREGSQVMRLPEDLSRFCVPEWTVKTGLARACQEL